MNRETRMPLADGRPLVEARVLQTYTLELSGPRRYAGPFPLIEHFSREWLREAEENLNDLLPKGYSVRIREWSEE